MRKYSLHLVTVIFLITVIASCKKETALPKENTAISPRSDTVLVNQNIAPRVYAGFYVKIELPKNFTVLQGGLYNADRNIKKVEWRKVSGPDSCIIVDKDSLETFVSNLREGVYEFELTVTDTMNLYGKDTVIVEVVKGSSDEVIVREHEIIFKNLVWIFPWDAVLEVKNISTYIPTVTPIKVFVQRDNASEWKEASPVSYNGNSSVYEYSIETRSNGAGMQTYGSLYIFYYGADTNDTPDVKIQY